MIFAEMHVTSGHTSELLGRAQSVLVASLIEVFDTAAKVLLTPEDVQVTVLEVAVRTPEAFRIVVTAYTAECAGLASLLACDIKTVFLSSISPYSGCQVRVTIAEGGWSG